MSTEQMKARVLGGPLQPWARGLVGGCTVGFVVSLFLIERSAGVPLGHMGGLALSAAFALGLTVALEQVALRGPVLMRLDDLARRAYAAPPGTAVPSLDPAPDA